jgi:hypothetical protein
MLRIPKLAVDWERRHRFVGVRRDRRKLCVAGTVAITDDVRC